MKNCFIKEENGNKYFYGINELNTNDCKIDLTLLYGKGNEPTLEEFMNTEIGQSFYKYRG